MSIAQSERPAFDGGNFSQADLLIGLQAHFGPNEDAFLQALDHLRAVLGGELLATMSRSVFSPPETLPEVGACGYAAEAARDAAEELDLPVPVRMIYGVPKATVERSKAGAGYHYWVAIGKEGQRVIVDGSHPGRRALAIAPEEEYLAGSNFEPYRRGDQPGSAHELTADTLERTPNVMGAGVQKLSVDARAAFYQLLNSLDDVGVTLTDEPPPA